MRLLIFLLHEKVGSLHLTEIEKEKWRYKNQVTVQNPFGFAASCCAKQRIEKSFSALTCYYFVDKNDDFLSVYQTCG